MLSADYRPIARPDLDPVLPRNPRRVKAFMYACAQFSARKGGIVEKAGAPAPNRQQRRAGKRAPKRKGR